jgi:protein kinase A
MTRKNLIQMSKTTERHSITSAPRTTINQPPDDVSNAHIPRSTPIDIPAKHSREQKRTFPYFGLLPMPSEKTAHVGAHTPSTLLSKSPQSPPIPGFDHQPNVSHHVASCKLNDALVLPSPANTPVDTANLNSVQLHLDYCISRHSAVVPYCIDDFVLLLKIGSGGCATVFKARRKMDGKIFAIKVMKREVIHERKQHKHVLNEKKMMEATRGAKWITQMFTSFKDTCHLFMVEEYLAAGDLLQYLTVHGRMDNDVTRFYGAQLALGLSYLHSEKILHRDIKPGNLFFDICGNLKLGDLGYAKRLRDGVAHTFCGTPGYMAPELIKRTAYGREADWWGYGIILYQMNSAHSPFQEQTAQLTFERILSGKIMWPDPAKFQFSPQCQHLIEGLLNVHVSRRFNEHDVKSHKFFSMTDWVSMDLQQPQPPTETYLKLIMNAMNQDQDDPSEITTLTHDDFLQDSFDYFEGF